ncbi:Cell surface hydrolase [Furfurilactobacillus rossiae]|uniref:alpha/beta hydrolase n=1 Tax=Furfurilactobacillus rossiae TaxID=231049 RepID=UPI0015BE1A98|nr:alpha/beta hydrolase [Furfurilactobacillus rossiae]MCF6165574.1 alpha/beta hydrolase [Furfurilactobacillus rossiae]QLE63388.1 Cell surface hydrolase [Furfurilactobacillus rossiae]
MKQKIIDRGFWTLLALVFVAVIGGGIFQAHRVAEAKAKYVPSSVPTLFFHGGGSNYHAEEHMTSVAKREGATNTIIRAFVSKTGHVHLDGTIGKRAINPIVEVNYANNRQLDFNKHGQWAKNVVVALQKKYHITKFNMVGHSLGNISLIYYMLEYGQDKRLPKLQKQVDMAGHFAGLNFKRVPASIRQPAGLKLDKSGKPNKMNATYKQMTKLRQTFPKHQVDVLNIYGDIGGQTDGTVPNVSSLSLRYLIADRAKSYHERKITGTRAKHTLLHNNAQVDRMLADFLWAK